MHWGTVNETKIRQFFIPLIKFVSITLLLIKLIIQLVD